MGRGIDPDLINPFVGAFGEVLRTTCSIEAKRENVFLVDKGGDITGISGVVQVGGEVSGNVVFSFEERLAVAAANKVGEQSAGMSPTALKGIGELTALIINQIKEGWAGRRTD